MDRIAYMQQHPLWIGVNLSTQSCSSSTILWYIPISYIVSCIPTDIVSEWLRHDTLVLEIAGSSPGENIFVLFLKKSEKILGISKKCRGG